ncbi:MAG: TVP38/TMEM64 family protein [Nitrospiraceae bacterium]|nr:TVP38/TMEM64 family protein [Nitrospiraceae bacterium]
MFKLDRKSILQLVAIAFLLTGGTYLLYSFGLIDLFLDRHRMLKFIRDHRAYAAMLFIGLQALQVVAAPVPGEVTGFVGGYFFGNFWGIVYSTIGLTIGSWAAFLLARALGRHLVDVFVKPDVIKRYDYVMKHKGLFLAFLMFLIPGFPKDILCYILGLGNMGQREFLLVSTTGRLFGTALLTLGGTFFRDQRYGAFFTVISIGITAVLVVMVYREEIEGWFRKLRLRQHRETRAKRQKRNGGEGDDSPNEP